MFKNLKQLDVHDQKTIEFDLESYIGYEASLILRCAGQMNKAYFNALLRKADQMKPIKSKKKLTTSDLNDNRNDDRILFSKFVIVGWTGILDENNEFVEFSQEKAYEFFVEMPDWLFDLIRDYAADVNNFVDDPDRELIAKN